MNTVIAGEYTNGMITYKNKKKGFQITVAKMLGLVEKKYLMNPDTVESWELYEETSKTSFASGAARSAVGGIAFGPVGAVIGAATAKEKKSYKVSVVFKDGTRALCELDDIYYKWFLELMY